VSPERQLRHDSGGCRSCIGQWRGLHARPRSGLWIGCRITAIVPVMAKGFNHAIQLAVSTAPGRANCSVSMLSKSHMQSQSRQSDKRVVGVRPLRAGLAVEGFFTAITGMRAVYSASLAKRGFTGRFASSKANGLVRMFDQPMMWIGTTRLDHPQSVMKKYCR